MSLEDYEINNNKLLKCNGKICLLDTNNLRKEILQESYIYG